MIRYPLKCWSGVLISFVSGVRDDLVSGSQGSMVILFVHCSRAIYYLSAFTNGLDSANVINESHYH